MHDSLIDSLIEVGEQSLRWIPSLAVKRFFGGDQSAIYYRQSQDRAIIYSQNQRQQADDTAAS